MTRNERISVFFGGEYEELWDETYHCSIAYKDRKQIWLRFCGEEWRIDEENTLPELKACYSSAAVYFNTAASAQLAVRRFIASGLTEQQLDTLSPGMICRRIFAAECMRMLLDDYGMKLETVWPYAALLLDGETESEPLPVDLKRLQPRTAAILSLLFRQKESIPVVLHDLRLARFRDPAGAVTTGTEVRISFLSRMVDKAVLELYGDSFSSEYIMKKTDEGWETSFSAPEEAAALWYRFRILSREKQYWVCPSSDACHAWLQETPKDGFRFTVYEKTFKTPDWFKKAVLYQIFPDRFAFSSDGTAERGIAYHRSLGQTAELHLSVEEEPRWQPREGEKEYLPDDFYGGTLRGIREKLPYLQQLGITCLYLNPIFEARSNHRYDTSDYMKIDPIAGTDEDFSLLCASAESLGIRVLCDGVFSHTGADSVYFNRDGHYPLPGACQSEPSPYDTWYDFRHFPDDYRSWWGFRELPEVEENDRSWQQFVVSGEHSAVKKWLRLGASGWRLDVADELPDDILCLIRKSAREEKEDALILGEVWEDAVLKESYGARRRYALGASLDSVMNYPFRAAVLDFLHRKIDAWALCGFLTSQQQHYPRPMYLCLMNLLGSHDVERIRTNLAVETELKDLSRREQLSVEKEIGDAALKRAEQLSYLAAVIQFSIPGVPSIYYGDELGMTGVNDPFNRRPMEWQKDGCTFQNRIRELIRLRSSHRALTEGDAFFLAADADVILILRTCSEERALSVINRSDEKKSYFADIMGIQASGEVNPCDAVIRFLTC